MAKFYMSVARLRKHKACPASCLLFIQQFGHGKVLVTKKHWVRAYNAGLDVGWAFSRRYGIAEYYKLKYSGGWGASVYNWHYCRDMWEYIKNVEGINDYGNPTKT